MKRGEGRVERGKSSIFNAFWDNAFIVSRLSVSKLVTYLVCLLSNVVDIFVRRVSIRLTTDECRYEPRRR